MIFLTNNVVAADEYSNAVKALEYINENRPIRVLVIDASNGIYVNIGGVYNSVLTTFTDVGNCTPHPNWNCIFKAFNYFKTSLEMKGYKIQGTSTLTNNLSSKGQYSFSGQTDFMRYVKT